MPHFRGGGGGDVKIFVAMAIPHGARGRGRSGCLVFARKNSCTFAETPSSNVKSTGPVEIGALEALI